MKLLILLLSLFTISFSKVEQKYENDKDKFIEEIKGAYEVYYEYYYSENDDFTLLIVSGICSNKNVYGVYFSSSEANKYRIDLFNENHYSLKKYNNRNDIKTLAFSVDKSLEVCVYQGDNKISLPVRVFLSPFEKSDLPQDKIITGNNLGCKLYKLSINKPITFEYIYIGASIIISSCLIIIFIFMKMKKGLFDKKTRHEGVFNFKDFYNQEIEEDIRDQFEVIEKIEEEKEETEEVKEVYQKSERYETEYFEESNFQVEEYLSSLGFVTDYKILSEEEKKMVMIELMQLRDTKKISNDQYLEETYKLWKK